MTNGWRVTTGKGSVYCFFQNRKGQWYVVAKNMPTDASKDISGRAWEIQSPIPWPPKLGKSIMFLSQYVDNPEHVDRMPGGGKITSLLRLVEMAQFLPEEIHA